MGMFFMFGVKLLAPDPRPAEAAPQHKCRGALSSAHCGGPARGAGGAGQHMITMYGSHLSTGLFAQDAEELQALVLRLDGLLNEPEASVEVCASGPHPVPTPSRRAETGRMGWCARTTARRGSLLVPWFCILHFAFFFPLRTALNDSPLGRRRIFFDFFEGGAAQNHSEAGYGRPVDRGVWTAKTVKRPRQQPAQPPIRQLLGAANTQTAHPATFSTAPAHQRHQQEHRPQRPTERSDPTQHAKGRTGGCPGPRKGATTRRDVTRGGHLLGCWTTSRRSFLR